MQSIRDRWATEPAVIIGAVTALVSAGAALLVAFGVRLTNEQTAAVLGATGAILALVQALTTRAQVTPTAQVAAQTADPTGEPTPGAAAVAGPADDDPTGTPVDVTPADGEPPAPYVGEHRPTPGPTDPEADGATIIHMDGSTTP